MILIFLRINDDKVETTQTLKSHFPMQRWTLFPILAISIKKRKKKQNQKKQKTQRKEQKYTKFGKDL